VRPWGNASRICTPICLSVSRRLIAKHLQHDCALTDEYIEHLYLFAPLHDIGKIGIPDSILLKPGPLTPAERVVMETHVNKGVVVLQRLIGDFQLDQLPDADVMVNVVEAHHECLDGSGSPIVCLVMPSPWKHASSRLRMCWMP